MKKIIGIWVFVLVIEAVSLKAQLVPNGRELASSVPFISQQIQRGGESPEQETEQTPKYKVGANYHATTTNFVTKPGVFLRYYHETETRMKVQEQLQEMADSGGDIVKTFIWLVDDPEQRTPDTPESGGAWRLAFPLSGQDLANVVQYAMDVANIRSRDGHTLELRFNLGWLGCADYQRENVDGTYTWCHYTWDQFVQLAKESAFNLVYSVGQIKRADGKPVVTTIYLDGEVMVGAKPRQEEFLLDIYPAFVEWASDVGITPTIYFLVSGSEEEIFHDGFTDPDYPAINGHGPLLWMFRTTEFMRENDLPLPEKLDFSFYPTPAENYVRNQAATYKEMVEEVMGDIRAVYGGVLIGVMETYYFPDPDSDLRWEIGQAFANEFLLRGRPNEVIFWPFFEPGPAGGGRTVEPSSPPFNFEAYKPQQLRRFHLPW